MRTHNMVWDAGDLKDILGLVGVRLSVKMIRALTSEQVNEVGQWAALEYLAASDNDVHRKPRPACLNAAECSRCSAMVMLEDAVTCRQCGRMYLRCARHGGREGAKRSLTSHKGICPCKRVTP